MSAPDAVEDAPRAPGTVLHSHVSVDGLLAMDTRDLRRWSKGLTINGREIRNPGTLRRALIALLNDDVHCLPIGEPCEGWSYATGCPGHRGVDHG